MCRHVAHGNNADDRNENGVDGLASAHDHLRFPTHMSRFLTRHGAGDSDRLLRSLLAVETRDRYRILEPVSAIHCSESRLLRFPYFTLRVTGEGTQTTDVLLSVGM